MWAGGEVPVDPAGLGPDVVSIGWVGRGESAGACENEGILCEGMFEAFGSGCAMLIVVSRPDKPLRNGHVSEGSGKVT